MPVQALQAVKFVFFTIVNPSGEICNVFSSLSDYSYSTSTHPGVSLHFYRLDESKKTTQNLKSNSPIADSSSFKAVESQIAELVNVVLHIW